MADQQFLASFGVDIDESGVSRLQTVLTENRTLAESLSTAFDAASESVKAFREQVATDLPTLFSGSGYGNVTENLFGSAGGLKIGLDMTEPKKEMSSFTADAKKPIGLTANASGIVSAARTALENVRSLFSETFVLNVRADTSTDNFNTMFDGRYKGIGNNLCKTIDIIVENYRLWHELAQSENLGHATVAFTMDIYAHVTEAMKKRSGDRMQEYIDSLQGVRKEG